MDRGTRRSIVWVVAVALASASTVAAVEGINNVNQQYQIPYPGAGAGGNVYYDAFTGETCSAGASQREDGWGIFKVTSCEDTTTGEGWRGNAPGGKEYYGIYYGRIDTSVVRGDSGEYEVQSQNVYFAIYENSVGTFAGLDQGSAGRTGFAQYDGITDGKLMLSGVLTANGLYELTYTLNENDTIASSYYTTRVTALDGAWCGTYDIVYGSDGPMHGDGMSYTGTGNWTASSTGSLQIGYLSIGFTTYDMTTVYAPIPEPITMGLLGAGSMALLLRRRNR